MREGSGCFLNKLLRFCHKGKLFFKTPQKTEVDIKQLYAWLNCSLLILHHAHFQHLMNLTKTKVTFPDIEYQRKYLSLKKNTSNVSRDVRAVDNSWRSTLTGLVTNGLSALECCQKANTKLHSRRLKPLWILSLLHNVLEADSQEAASNYERQIETGAGGAHCTVTEGRAEFGIGNHLVWAGLCFTVRH